jgi:hypothetical protein
MTNRAAEIGFEVLDRLSTGKAISDAACPVCGPDCKTESNKRRKVLRIWCDDGFITYKCARCDISGWAKAASDYVSQPRREPVASETKPDKSELAGYLWSRSVSLLGSPAETYLRSRSCFIASENLRYLPPRNAHKGAMIARFGMGAITGIHLTKLKHDGSGKAGTESDKISIGLSLGQPIVLQDNAEREELCVAEGIEDAASLALVTGWSAWSAGTANRIPPVLAGSTSFPKVYCAVDLDWGKRERVRAGPKALNASRAIRRDLIPLRIEKALGLKDKIDSNKALMKFGPDVLLAAIEWCDSQERFARREIGYHEMMRGVAHSEAAFKKIAERDDYMSPASDEAVA